MSNTVIKVEGLSKLYRLGEVGTGSLAHDVNRWWHRVRGKEDPYLKIGQTNDRTRSAKPETGNLKAEKGSEEAENLKSETSSLKSQVSSLSSDYVFALKNVSFDVQQGEVLGIIGRNGAGKSTLLKILSRVTVQTTGRIRVKGRIASLLEVGTGFHPELTGRENVYLNGAILGMRKAEIRAKFDEIVDFSGCERYIDTPVKRYSSGMYVRLAFAVAAHLEPEILIVDEVLAVGDAEFQKKCLGKMKDVAGHGRTVLFVSHNMTAVQSLCPRAILMSNGTIEFDGLTEATVRRYLVEAGSSPSMIQWDELDEAPGAEYMRLQSIKAISLRSDNEDASLFDLKTPINIQINYRVYNEADFHITLHFITETGEVAFTSGGCCVEVDQDMPQSGDYELTCHVPENLLNEGKYFIKIMLIENKSRCVYQCDNIISFDVNDLSPRPIGSWHKREPGHVKPLLNWDLMKLSSNV